MHVSRSDHWRLSSRRDPRPPPRPSLPLRPNSLHPTPSQKHPSLRHRLHEFCRLERRRSRAFLDGSAGAGGGDVCVASGLYWVYCAYAGLLDEFAEGGEEGGVDGRVRLGTLSDRCLYEVVLWRRWCCRVLVTDAESRRSICLRKDTAMSSLNHPVE